MAATRNISIYRGDTYVHEIRIRDSANAVINISGRTYSAQIKRSSSSSNTVVSFTSTITDAANGVLQISLTTNQTANLRSGIYKYDLQEINGSNVLTLMTGNVTVAGDITR
jgi:transcriptional regulator of nitric oxide reductase